MKHKYEIENLTNKELLYVLKVNGCCHESIDWVRKTGADLKKAWAEFPKTQYLESSQLYWFVRLCVCINRTVDYNEMIRVAKSKYFMSERGNQATKALRQTFKIV